MSYYLIEETYSHFKGKDPRSILMDATLLIEGVQHALLYIGGSDYTLDKNTKLLDSWDSIIEIATEEINYSYEVETHSVSQPISDATLEKLGSGNMYIATKEVFILMQRLSMNIILGHSYTEITNEIKEVLSQYASIRDTLEEYGLIRTAYEQINNYVINLTEMQLDTAEYAESASGYLSTCNAYTHAVIGQPGYYETNAYRTIVENQSGSLTNADSQIIANIDEIELKMTQLNGINNSVLLSESNDLYDASIALHSQSGVMIESAKDNTDLCIDTAINGYEAYYEYPFSLSEKIRITAVVPGPSDISVSYTITATAPSNSIEVAIDTITKHIQIGFSGTQPPTINEVVSQLNSQMSEYITAVNLDLSGTDGGIKANHSFVRTRLVGLIIT